MNAPDTSLTPVAARLRFALVRLARSLRRDTKTGLTASQVSALATVEDFGLMRISTLATHEAIDPSVATRVVAGLENQGFLQRQDDPDDKRACLINLSEHGRLAVEELWRERAVKLASRLERLNEGERRAVEAALPALEKLARDN